MNLEFGEKPEIMLKRYGILSQPTAAMDEAPKLRARVGMRSSNV